MNALPSSAAAYFPRRDESTSIAQLALVAAAAGFTAFVWLSIAGAGDQPRGYLDVATAGMNRVTLPKVEIVGDRAALARADADEVAGCTADRSAHKPG